MARSVDLALTQFSSYLKRSKRSSDLTIAHYHDYLTRFFESQSIQTTTDITLKKIDLFRKELEKSGLQPATQNYYLIAIRGFVRWLPNAERRVSYKAITLTPIQYHSPTPLPKHSIAALLTDPKNTKELTILALRDRAILELLWGTDLKLQELPTLIISHFNAKKKDIAIPGPRERILKVNNHSSYYITEYLKLRNDQNPYLFISHDRAGSKRSAHQNISTRSIQRLITKQSRRAGQGRSITARTIQRTRITAI
jgi:site-specific recombinase XerD